MIELFIFGMVFVLIVLRIWSDRRQIKTNNGYGGLIKKNLRK